MSVLPIYFARVVQLPENPVPGTIYFVSEEKNAGLWIGTGEGQILPYTPQEYVQKDDNFDQVVQTGVEVVDDTLIIHDPDIATVQNGVLRTSSLFAEVNGDTLIYNYGTN